MSDLEKIVSFDSDSNRPTSGPVAASRRCESSATHQVLVFFIITSVLLTTACIVQCVIIRQENAVIRHQVEILQERVDKQLNNGFFDDNDIPIEEPGGSEPEVYGYVNHRHRRNARQQGPGPQRESQRRTAMHFSLDKHHLTEAIQRQLAGGDAVDYSSHDIRWKPTLNSSLDHHHNDYVHSITVNHAGLYLIYGQLTYHNPAAKSSFHIKLNDRVILKCLQSVDMVLHGSVSSNDPGTPANGGVSAQAESNARVKTCYTAGVFAVSANDLLSMANKDRPVLNDSHANFWGLVRLDDA